MNWQETLRGRAQEIAEKKITVGFDGFVDTIARPIRQAAVGGMPAQPFATIREFGEFLIGKAEKSCSVELSVAARQLGGNLPFLSRAAGGLGLSVSCIGMLGSMGAVEPVFADMPCTLYPFAPPGQSTCLEFQDGKVMLAADCTLPEDAWTLVLRATDGNAPKLIGEADLLALVNWSELSFVDALWTKALDAVAADGADKERFAFFDLCDVSRKTNEALEAVLRLIGRFSAFRTSILSLNENEARIMGERLLDAPKELAEIAQAIRMRYGVDEVLVHTIRQSLLLSPRGITVQPTCFVAHPKISTGAGDHFNGASCFAAVLRLEDADRIAFANRFAHLYVSQGRSPNLADLGVL